MNAQPNYFEVLRAINVNGHTEKKGKFTYLSWPFAYAELFKLHPNAEIEVREWNGFPAVKGPKGWMVCVSVTVCHGNHDVKRTQWHPILDGANRPIAEPDVFQINTSIQRAAVKAIALHGLGLYIYAGEDLPDTGEEPEAQPETEAPKLTGKPQDGMTILDFPFERQPIIQEHADNIRDLAEGGQIDKAAKAWKEADLPHEEKAAVWFLLPSNHRSAITKLLRGKAA